ncbi:MULTISPECIES: ABC transporter ATP-binding protein [unclassified Pseudoalteromonas]|uniref:ABC transporter ATP-binding protein n=1 Tax=unclassified Pseudoalteromonas TaxID=194690 RepID=UPI001D16DFEE|nr:MULTISPECIES: ABC transporter ATP-binding protein [Gammaproteobacteria]MCF7517585.1 ABC transporter ATP-binding protein [Pseudoalteromonas sp. L21]UJX25247.1 ABC transporter ATP-binding protein [Pseudoalteromonas sp. CF6-2]|tara:strand:- start:9833 stop:10516 length:684 start_codon:yes stop_codon:yes gene_type:complete
MTNQREEIATCSQVTKYYKKGEFTVTALKRACLSLFSGELVAVTGPSGSGKSTLLNVLGLLDAPSDGELHLFGEACHSMSRNEKQSMRRRYMGFIFQNFNLLPVLSAVENVELSLYGLSLSKTKMREAAIAMLAKVGLEQRAYHYPSELSGGQQQRVGIARALVHNPKLVMADEPTANLDSETASQIVQLMRKLAHEQGTTFLVSSHDARLMSKVDRTLSLTDGVLM